MDQDPGPTEGDPCVYPSWTLLGPPMGVESYHVTGPSPDACSMQVGDINDWGEGAHNYMMMGTMTENVPYPNTHQRPVSLNMTVTG